MHHVATRGRDLHGRAVTHPVLCCDMLCCAECVRSYDGAVTLLGNFEDSTTIYIVQEMCAKVREGSLAAAAAVSSSDATQGQAARPHQPCAAPTLSACTPQHARSQQCWWEHALARRPSHDATSDALWSDSCPHRLLPHTTLTTALLTAALPAVNAAAVTHSPTQPTG